ncbi:hypothetical protein [uncultured Tenacibaculum sp.]|uniref:hypothetical protein n=1 Tax=uncultured Tenacibaculum sp. TaxID=174713 RepID=UPI0026259F35|nr:hypothetical protein [uncultured Tenacibaculum sp.]
MKLLQLVNRTILALVLLVCFSFTTTDEAKNISNKEITNLNITNNEFCVEIDYYQHSNRIEAVSHFIRENELVLLYSSYSTIDNKVSLRVRKQNSGSIGTEVVRALDNDYQKPPIEIRTLTLSYRVKSINCNNQIQNRTLENGIIGF